MALVTVSLLVQTPDAEPLEHVRYTVLNVAETVVYDTGLTSSTGASEEMELEDGATYSIRLVKPYTTFSEPETIVVAPVTDPQEFTLEGTYVDPAVPSGQDLCRVYGIALHTDGTPYTDADVVVDNLFGDVILGDWSIFGPRMSGRTSATGQFEVEVLRGATVRIVVQGTTLAARVVIPDQSMVHINELLEQAEAEIQDVVE